MIVLYLSQDVSVGGCNAAQPGEQQRTRNSLFYHQHVHPQNTNSTAKGFSGNLQPLYAVSTRGRKQISKEKTD